MGLHTGYEVVYAEVASLEVTPFHVIAKYEGPVTLLNVTQLALFKLSSCLHICALGCDY